MKKQKLFVSLPGEVIKNGLWNFVKRFVNHETLIAMLIAVFSTAGLNNRTALLYIVRMIIVFIWKYQVIEKLFFELKDQ